MSTTNSFQLWLISIKVLQYLLSHFPWLSWFVMTLTTPLAQNPIVRNMKMISYFKDWGLLLVLVGFQIITSTWHVIEVLMQGLFGVLFRIINTICTFVSFRILLACFSWMHMLYFFIYKLISYFGTFVTKVTLSLKELPRDRMTWRCQWKFQLHKLAFQQPHLLLWLLILDNHWWNFKLIQEIRV